MSAAKCIEIMLYRRVIFFVRCLDTAFRHHCVGIADAKLCHNHDIRSRLMCLDRCRSTCSSAADDEHIHVIVNLREIDVILQKTAVGMQHMHQLFVRLLAFVRSYLDLLKCFRAVIRMKLAKQLILLLRGHTTRLHSKPGRSGRLHLFYRFHHFRCKHDCVPPYFSISLVL